MIGQKDAVPTGCSHLLPSSIATLGGFSCCPPQNSCRTWGRENGKTDFLPLLFSVIILTFSLRTASPSTNWGLIQLLDHQYIIIFIYIIRFSSFSVIFSLAFHQLHHPQFFLSCLQNSYYHFGNRVIFPNALAQRLRFIYSLSNQ